MLRWFSFPLLLVAVSLSAQSAELSEVRWQGRWGDGLRDALILTPAADANAKQMKVHYWRKLNADWQQAELQFDALATVQQAQPLTLQWKIEGDPQQGSMQLVYQPADDTMTLHYTSVQQQGSMTMRRATPTTAAQSGAEPCLQPSDGAQAVTLRWHAPDAKAVYLAGEMNDWQADTLPLQRQADGDWALTLYLTPGRWAYKLVQDGQWLSDPHNPLRHADGQGGFNSLLQIGATDPLFTPRANPAERGQLQTITLTGSDHAQHPVLIYRPAGSDPHTPLPWLLALHGYGMDRQQWVADGELPTLLDNLIAGQQIPPLAVVLVDGGKSFYQGATEQFLIRDLLPQVGHWGLSTRPQQRALLGVSMGGFGAFYLAYRHPQQFAQAVSLSGYFAPRPQAEWTSSGLQAMSPTRLYCGLQDHTSLASNQALQEQLQRAGVTPPFHYSAGGHTWHYWQGLLPQVIRELAQQIATPSGR